MSAFAYMYVRASGMHSGRPEVGVGSPRTEITDCELPYRRWESNSGLLEAISSEPGRFKFLNCVDCI